MERQAAERGKNAMDGTKLEEFEMVRPVEKSYGPVACSAPWGYARSLYRGRKTTFF